MDERTIQGFPPELPLQTRTEDSDRSCARRPLDDPRALTILTTEHWNLLSARSLVYNEAFARGGMFLSFLSASLVALGLLSTATGFSSEFLLLAAVLLGIDLFIGIATLARVASATSEDLRYLQGMNRLRHAYHETVPGLERYFISGHHDDLRGVFMVYGPPPRTRSRATILHGFTTTPGMIGVICAAVGGVLAGVLLLLLNGTPLIASAGALGAFGLGVVAAVVTMTRRIRQFASSMRPVFPSPPTG
jgi:hypothetical protein